MAKHKVSTPDAEIDRAIGRAQVLENEPRVVNVEYRPGPGLDLLILTMNDGHRHVIPREDLQGLESATKAQIGDVEIVGRGTGLHWTALDLDHYVPALLRRIYGSRSWMSRIGKRGGSVKSTAKKVASRANGLRGGRPRQGELERTAREQRERLSEAHMKSLQKSLQQAAERSKGARGRTA